MCRLETKSMKAEIEYIKVNKYHNDLVYLDCILVTKKEYSVDLAKKNNKNLSSVQYRDKTFENLKSLALKHANYIPEESKIKLLEIEGIATELMDQDEKTKKSAASLRRNY